MVTADGAARFTEAVRPKLLLEIAGRMPQERWKTFGIPLETGWKTLRGADPAN